MIFEIAIAEPNLAGGETVESFVVDCYYNSGTLGAWLDWWILRLVDTHPACNSCSLNSRLPSDWKEALEVNTSPLFLFATVF